MNDLKTSYEVVAIGNIQMRAIQDSQIDKILDQNRDAIEEIWRKAQEERGGALFNGTLPNFIRIVRERGGDRNNKPFY